MQLSTLPIDNTSLASGEALVSGEAFYQQLNRAHNPIISIQYARNEFLSFYVSQAHQGNLVKSGTEVIGLGCQIKDSIYTFNREHFYQLSNREVQALFNHLGIDSREFFKS